MSEDGSSARGSAAGNAGDVGARGLETRAGASSAGGTIGLRVNGEAVRVAAGISVRGLIEAHGLGGVPCAAEVDGRLVPRREHEGRVLVDGESVELVSLVGGG